MILGLLCGYIWPVVQTGIDWVGHALIGAGSLGLFIYGVLNRLLLITGLHHILNSLVWFVFGSYPGPEANRSPAISIAFSPAIRRLARL